MSLFCAEISGSEVSQEWQPHVGVAFEQNDRMPRNKMPSSSPDLTSTLESDVWDRSLSTAYFGAILERFSMKRLR